MAADKAEPAEDKAQRLILRGGRSAAIGLAIRFGARILFLFVAARLFGAVLFGAYSIAVAVVELGVAVGLLGMKRLLFKRLDEDEEGREPIHSVLDAAIVVSVVSLVIAGALMLVVALPPVHDLLGETAFPLLLVAPMIAGQALLDLFCAATRWKHRMRYEVVARSIVEPYAATLATIAAFFAGFQLTGLLIGYWAGTLLALGYAIYGVRRSFGGFALARYRLPRGRVRALLGENALPTLSDFASALFTRLDIYLVGLILGEGPTGIYGVARQVRTPIRQVRQSFDGLLTPIIARTLSVRGPVETGRAAASASRLILAIQLGILVVLAAVGQPLLGWFGPEFAPGYWALLLLAAAETIQGAFGVSELILLYRKPAMVLRITMATTTVNLAAALVLIPWLGVDGAAWAVLAAMIAGALIRRHALASELGIRIPLRHNAGPIAAAALAAPAIFLLPEPFGLPAGLIIYAATLKLWLATAGDTLALAHFQMEKDGESHDLSQSDLRNLAQDTGNPA